MVIGPNERYPEVPDYIFKGRKAFDLHLKLAHLADEFEQGFTEAEKSNCVLLVTRQTTVSKATLKNPQLAPRNPRRRIKLYFYIKEQMIPSGKAYSEAADWLQLLEAEPNNLLGLL
jgi:hypothetical protein